MKVYIINNINKSYILNIRITPIVTEYALISAHSFNTYAYFGHSWSYFDIQNLRLVIKYTLSEQYFSYCQSVNKFNNIYIHCRYISTYIYLRNIISCEYLNLSLANEYVGDVTIPTQVINCNQNFQRSLTATGKVWGVLVGTSNLVFIAAAMRLPF